MSTHISDDIPLLLTGEAQRDTVLAAAAHLRVCADCQQELVSAVVAHASLTSAQRFAPEIVAQTTGRDDDELPEPTSLELPDLSAVFSRAREEAAVPKRRAGASRGRLLAVAAASAVVLAGAGVLVANIGSDGSSSTASSCTARLAAFQHGTAPASVKVVDNGTLRVDATKLPRLDAGHVYELWLTDGARTKMQSVGLIGNDNRAQLTVNPKVMAQYSDFEVSVQRTNQTPYSGISVLRGSYC